MRILSSKDVIMLTEFKMHVFGLEKMSFWVPKKKASYGFQKARVLRETGTKS